MVEEPNRDASEAKGLWRGYCYTNSSSEKLAVTDRPPLLSTPMPLATPGDPFYAVALTTVPTGLGSSDDPTPSGAQSWYASLHPEQRLRGTAEPRGLHLLQGLDERLRREKAAAEREEQIIAEFDDTFITQVYNYLSLGYPALARGFDEELSKISRISLEELEHDDSSIMDNLWAGRRMREASSYADGDRPVGSPRKTATGHILIDSEEKQGLSEVQRCPRWKALRLYIYEWARQHPDLNSISPLAWGVRERRGSWGI
jgi:hypothetical protein